MSLECSPSPPHPPPSSPPPPPPTAPASVVGEKMKLYQAIASSRSAVEGDYTEPLLLLGRWESSFTKDLQWILVNTYVPSLIQNGPQCGLVALKMAAHLRQPQLNVDLETVVETAKSRGYTAQGEMFSAKNLAALAEEVYCCKAELLSGGLSGDNAEAVISHLWGRQPVLIPYDEFYEPRQLNGHRAHWAVLSGVLLGLDRGSVCVKHYQRDPTLHWLNCLGDQASPPCPVSSSGLRQVYVLAKQGKSLHYQIWSLDSLADSNKQLREMCPQRANSEVHYVVPKGGIEAGLAGQAVLLHTRTQEQGGVQRSWNL